MSVKERVLIAYTASFARYEFFERKVASIIPNASGFDVVCLTDYQGFVHRYFGEGVEERKERLSFREKRKIVESCSHLIFFWDGTELSDFIYLSILLGRKVKIIPVKTTRVANKDKGDEYDAYIGRGSPWGNPFAIGKEGMDRAEAIEKYRIYFEKEILGNPDKKKGLLSLKGLRLGCHCKPLDCHGDVIAGYLNGLEDENDASG